MNFVKLMVISSLFTLCSPLVHAAEPDSRCETQKYLSTLPDEVLFQRSAKAWMLRASSYRGVYVHWVGGCGIQVDSYSWSKSTGYAAASSNGILLAAVPYPHEEDPDLKIAAIQKVMDTVRDALKVCGCTPLKENRTAGK